MQCCKVAGESHSSKECCEDCEAPVCAECWHDVDCDAPSVPPAALANDMMIYYAPTILYREKVTMMEMICASVCVTSMICFTLEKKYRNMRSLNQGVHANVRRMACRGNGTSFPLPWHDLLKQLKNGEQQSVSLPRVGAELADTVSILLKTAGGGADEKSSARLIHQARVRRSVVVALIEEMQRRGHRAYKHVDMTEVRERAGSLPEDDVPPEIIRMLPIDGAHEKLQPNKNATPVVGEKSEEDLAKDLQLRRLNAVVCERSSHDQYDKVAQDRSCVEHTVRKLKGLIGPNSDESSTEGKDDEASDEDSAIDEIVLHEDASQRGSREAADSKASKEKENDAGDDKDARLECIGVETGSHLIDQFESVYFGIAFSFIFSYNCGFPDMPAFSKKARYRRSDDAPQIETWEWVRAMSRRVEASVSGDYTFGFLTWNY